MRKINRKVELNMLDKQKSSEDRRNKDIRI